MKKPTAAEKWASSQLRREELLRQATYGELTSDQVEAEAKRLGLEPFSREPDPARFDPSDELNWTLPMAVAWIAYRSLDAVRETWPAYCAECRDWHWGRWRNGPGGEVNEGWSLKQRAFPSLPHLELKSIMERAEEHDRPMIMSVKEAREALWIVLGESMLPATGVPRKGGGRAAIPALDWLALKPLDSDHRDEIGRDGIGMEYADPLVPSRGVRHLWGPRREDRDHLPATMAPAGDGYMPLSCAAQWIATEGGAVDFDPHDEAIWREAFDQLLGAIASERVRVVGLRSGGREPVPGYLFAGCVVDYPYADATLEVMTSENVYLRSYPYVDDERWRNGFDDSLVSRHKDHWTQLMVEKGDVRERWSFALSEPIGTGAPGRPSKSMHVILDELERRGLAGELEPTAAKQSVVLVDWLKNDHPMKARPKPKTVENEIRHRFRQLKNPPK